MRTLRRPVVDLGSRVKQGLLVVSLRILDAVSAAWYEGSSLPNALLPASRSLRP